MMELQQKDAEDGRAGQRKMQCVTHLGNYNLMYSLLESL